MDPGWSIAKANELLFVNSVKMKMAVIFGVLHMSFGIFHKGLNALFKKNYLDFFCEFVPGIFILWCLFGWMDMLILVKFFKTFDIDSPGGEFLNQGVDGIINIMVTTVFKFGGFDKKMFAIIGSSQDQQYAIALGLEVVAFILIPVMLCAKPCILKTPAD